MADQQIKEFEGLLENVEQVGANSRKNLKHYIKLILPHLLLVVAVCSYASVGAIVFHSIESPNEDALKTNGVERINRLRKELVEIMWEQRLQMQNIRANEMSPELLRMRDDWVSKIATKLQTFNENLYKAYKEEYVRYGDVRVTPQEQIKDPRLKRHRSSKSWTEKGGKMWTWSSALFFAATTMATIGYGNIVPVTVSGKIACIIFALIGAPLAIITIGDLGKFLSECTIWFYCKMQVYKKRIRKYWKMWKRRKAGVVVEYDQPDSPKSPTDPKSWEDELDKEDVPVLLVFVILLLYIAFGGVLFSVLESWTYVDAFYFSFVSLTTIGFGDLVPDRHEYIVIMLIYIGVGLAVTTMCIDLVGIQYIQKIHYFGRKFQNTDLLQLLKRKRLIERRLALGQGEEIIHIIQKMVDEEQKREPLPPLLPPLKSASQYWVNQVEEKYSLRSDSTAITPWNLPETIFEDGFSFFQAEPLLPPHLLSGPNSKRSSTISTPYTNSSSSARSIMYRAWGTNDRGGTSIESGPDISLRCSLSTPASVYEREFIFDNFRSPQPSVQSFKFTFPIEIDYKRIGDSARHSRRTNSAPSLIPASPPRKGKSPPVLSAASSTVRRKSSYRVPVASNVQFASPPVLLSLPSQTNPRFNFPHLEIPPPFMLSKLAAQCDELGGFGPEMPIRFYEGPRSFANPLSRTTIYEEATSSAQSLQPPNVLRHVPRLNLQTATGRRAQFFSRPLWYYRWDSGDRRLMLAPTVDTEEGAQAQVAAPVPVLKRKKLERQARKRDPIRKMDWLNVSPRSAALMDAVRNDLPTLFDQVRRTSAATSNTSSVVLVSPRNVSTSNVNASSLSPVPPWNPSKAHPKTKPGKKQPPPRWK